MNWKPNIGEIKDLRLGYRNFNSSNIDSAGNSMSYQCIVEYEYKSLQDNQILNGNKISVGYLPSNNKKGHLKIFEKISSANLVRIWENPKNKNETCISQGINRNSYFLISFGAMFILFAVSLMMLSTNKPPQSDKIYKVEVVE